MLSVRVIPLPPPSPRMIVDSHGKAYVCKPLAGLSTTNDLVVVLSTCSFVRTVSHYRRGRNEDITYVLDVSSVALRTRTLEHREYIYYHCVWSVF